MQTEISKSRLFGREVSQLRGQGSHPVDGGKVSGDKFGRMLEDATGQKGFNAKQISLIETGKRVLHHERDRSILLGIVCVLWRCGSLTTRSEADGLLILGGYGPLDDLEAATIDASWREPTKPDSSADPQTVNITVNNNYFFPTPQQLKRELRRWARYDEASDHMRSSWSGVAIYLLDVVVTRLKEARVHVLALWPLLLWGTVWLTQPLMQWPLGDFNQRLEAGGLFALAGVLVPFGVWLLTEAEQAEVYRKGGKVGLMRRLKLTGAVVGFNTFLLIGFIAALAWYYLAAGPLPIGGVWLLAAFALLWGRIVAARIPADRLVTFDGELKAHSADNLFLGVCFFFPAIASFYSLFFYEFLVQRWMGVVQLLVICAVIAWEVRKQ